MIDEIADGPFLGLPLPKTDGNARAKGKNDIPHVNSKKRYYTEW